MDSGVLISVRLSVSLKVSPSSVSIAFGALGRRPCEASQLRAGPVGLDEGLLSHVIDFRGVADHPGQQAQDLALVLQHQQIEGLLACRRLCAPRRARQQAQAPPGLRSQRPLPDGEGDCAIGEGRTPGGQWLQSERQPAGTALLAQQHRVLPALRPAYLPAASPGRRAYCRYRGQAAPCRV
ncbi:hypothetical protein G6F68_014734 [Rhizopus microsporus]|nr:hypothetical protein G6F68_014734 [Rhizopus microsporus]